MKSYPEYKASGIDWLGEIPSHWEISPLKYFCELYNGDSLNDHQKEIYSACKTSDAIPYIASKDIDRDSEYIDYDNGIKIPNNGDGFSVARPRTTLLCIEGGSAGKKMTFLERKVCFVNKLCCIDSNCNDKFTYYYICSNVFKNQFFHRLQGLIGGVTVSELKNFFIFLPPMGEQEAIAGYLDEVTGKIDVLIKEKKAQVEELRAYRSSLITETVTRGLNLDAPLRDSGIDWLGPIPQHWEVSKAAWTFDSIGSGTTPTSGADRYYNNGTVNWLQTGDLNDGIITSTSKKITQFAVNDNRLKIYPPRTLVIAMYGATIAKTGILSIDTAVNQACCVLLPSNKINNKFAFYYFNAAKTTLISFASGGGQPNISQAIIANFKTILPPLSEQQEIADFLDDKTAKIDSLIEELTKQLDELAEYRQAVITEAVTGKVDVRDYKPNI